MKLRLEFWRHTLLIATDDHADELDTAADELTDAVVGNGGGADLSVSEDGAPAEANRARRNRGVSLMNPGAP